MSRNIILTVFELHYPGHCLLCHLACAALFNSWLCSFRLYWKGCAGMDQIQVVAVDGVTGRVGRRLLADSTAIVTFEIRPLAGAESALLADLMNLQMAGDSRLIQAFQSTGNTAQCFIIIGVLVRTLVTYNGQFPKKNIGSIMACYGHSYEPYLASCICYDSSPSGRFRLFYHSKHVHNC